MMSVLALLIALLKAIPGLTKLATRLSDYAQQYEKARNEKLALERRTAKLAAIDAAIVRVRTPSSGQHSNPDSTPGLSQSLPGESRVDSKSAGDDSKP
jgi:Na+-transporting methylmalonyl-CoA/oxaloacetate decarboxylase gamma subunit